MLKKLNKINTAFKAGMKFITVVFVFIMFIAISVSGSAKEHPAIHQDKVIQELEDLYKTDKSFKTLMDKALSEAITPPRGMPDRKRVRPVTKSFWFRG
ncbi:MAG: hypothetical protein GY928_31045 [Colwellia sp.]|nr:hypothetical protein [Colwellia sp.]